MADPRAATEDAATLLGEAIARHRAGDLARAEAIYRGIVENQPRNSGALYLFGVLAHQLGEFPRARDLLGRAISIDAEVAAYHLKLADTLSALNLLDEAIAAYRRAIDLEPDDAVAHNNLGHAYLDQEKFGDAATAYQRAVDLRPDAAEAYNNLGNALRNQGDLDDAAAAYRRAIELRADYARAHDNLGNALRDQGRLDEAAAMHRRAIAFAPEYPNAYNNLGITLWKRGDAGAAAEAYRRAIALDPQNAAAHSNLAVVLGEQRKPEEAEAACRRALEIRPGYADAYNGLGNALMDQGRVREALAAFRQVLAIKPRYPVVHSNLIYIMSHDPQVKRDEILAEARRWDAAYAAPYAAGVRPYRNDPDPERRLRIGYVSPDFRSHAISYVFEGTMAAHDKKAVEVFCYAEVARPDAVTARYRQYADHWRPTVGLSDAEVAERIGDDRIDILVDLAGHTTGNRLLAFAGRPAPVQVSHLVGLGHTTGMTAIDYAISDRWLTPDGYDRYFSETLWRLPRSYIGFGPSPDWPDISPLPALAEGQVTFASFASPFRISAGAAELWARVLRAVPGSRMLLMHRVFADGRAAARLHPVFAAQGVGDRVEFRGPRRGWPADMDVYEEVDIALDTFPRTGGTTNGIALWMGLPVVTLYADEALDHIGADYLIAARFEGGVASSRDDYVAKAVGLAGDIGYLAGLRQGMRARLRDSDLLDHDGLARAIEDAYRDMWRKWCADRQPATLGEERAR